MRKVMRTRGDWNQRYESGELPWDTGRQDRFLAELVTDGTIAPCSALELGCGTGTNSIWLAGKGFDVTAIDISDKAIAAATGKAEDADVKARFLTLDILKDAIPGAPFDFAFDRGCFHSFDEPSDRSRFAEVVAGSLADNGIWLSEIGSTDGPPREIGPPRRSARDVMIAVEPHFELRCLESSCFDNDQDFAPRMWLCLMQKR